MHDLSNSLMNTFNLIVSDNIARRKYMNKSTDLPGQIAGILSLNFFATLFYRLSHYFFCKRLLFIAKLFYGLNLVLFGCDISPMTRIGAGFVMCHLNGITLHCKIGNNAILYGANGIGGRGGEGKSLWFGGPIIGDNLIMYRGANILADVRIGNNVTIGAMSLVLNSIDDNKLVMGIPAKVIRNNNE